MPLWSRLFSTSAPSHVREGDDGGEHGMPLLQNQESSEGAPKEVDADWHAGITRTGQTGYSNLLMKYLGSAVPLCSIRKIPLLAVALALTVGFVFIFHGRTSTSSSPLNLDVMNLTAAYFPNLGSRRLRIKYGPYTVPPMNVNNGMANFLNKNSAKPCEDCLITFIQAGLQYADGSDANADSGLWLHHVVQMDTAIDDTVCGKSGNNRRIIPNRFFASGNERSPINLCGSGTQRTGYFLSKDSSLVTAVELMNETPNNLTGILTIDYEFLPASPFPPSFQNLTSAWLDVGGCKTSDISVKSSSSFTLTMPAPWVFPKALFTQDAARIVSASGHLHDGGTHIEIRRNEATTCDSIATYGAVPDFVDIKSGMLHISNMTTCDGGSDDLLDEDSAVRPGDMFNLIAHYDRQAHAGMLEADGSPAPVMGIGIVYFAPRMSRNR